MSIRSIYWWSIVSLISVSSGLRLSHYTGSDCSESYEKLEMRFLRIVKLTGYTYYCSSLTNLDFEYEANLMTGNGNQVYLTKLDPASGSATTQEVTAARAAKSWKDFHIGMCLRVN